MFRLARMHKAF